MTEHFGEVLTAMVTPFDENLDVDLEQTAKLATYLVENGSDGLVVLGTTGEVPVLTEEEKVNILQTVVDEVGDRATIVAGTGSYSTAASINMTRKAQDIGVDGIMLVVPYYNKPPQKGLYKHFSMIAAETSLPVMIYNVPGRTSRNIEPDTVKDLSEIDNIIAIKEASGDVSQFSEITRITDEDFYVYSGDDNCTMPILSVGGQGIISVASHLVGKEIKKMIRAFKKGNVEEAIRLNKKLTPIFSGIFINTNPIPVKAALNMMGINVGGLRPPLIELGNADKEQLQKILKDTGVF
ncbi:MAG: 4-hydroxy-tetrahydrodipicolinate synthase [Halanaerobiaceae bacterium]